MWIVDQAKGIDQHQIRTQSWRRPSRAVLGGRLGQELSGKGPFRLS